MDNIALFICLALLAEILGTIGGFGSSLFFIPIASYFFDFQSVLGITALFHVSSNLSKIYLFRNGIDKKLIITIGIPAMIFVIIGAFLSKVIDTKLLEIIMSVFLILTSLFFLWKPTFSIDPSTKNSVIGGSLSGIAAGMIGTGGAIRGITLASFNLETEIFIATSAMIDLGIDSSRAIVYSFNGYVHFHDLYLIPILLIVSLIGTYLGKIILSKFSKEQFKFTILILILITGIITLFKSFFG